MTAEPPGSEPAPRLSLLSAPPFLLVDATSALACPWISAYYELCAKNGVPAEYLAGVEAVYTMFADWQEAHPDRVKMPGTET